jgi:hypothetical protein
MPLHSTIAEGTRALAMPHGHAIEVKGDDAQGGAGKSRCVVSVAAAAAFSLAA